MENDNEAQAEALAQKTAAEIEVELLKREQDEAVERAKTMNPADIASHFFRTFYPQYLSRVSGLSNKEARRLAEHLVQFPIHEQKPHFFSNEGKEAFGLGIRLIDAKLIMRETLHMEERQEAGLDQLPPEDKNSELVKQENQESTNV